MMQEARDTGQVIEALIYHERREQEATQQTAGTHPVYVVSESIFRQLTHQVSPEGLLTVISFDPRASWVPQRLDSLPLGPGFLLEEIQDPGNLGTIIRTADWLGFQAVICSKGCVDVLNPKVLRSSMGSIFRVPVYFDLDFSRNLENALDRVWAADMEGTPLHRVPFAGQEYLLIGNESQGLSQARRSIEGLRSLHIPGRGGAESLNAAVSAAVSGWQLFCSTLDA